jgi:nucleoside-diphosphate-sugar epimerase
VVIGGRGQSGRAICRRLVDGGWDVLATTSRRPPDDDDAGPGVRWAVLDRNAGAPEDESGALATVVPDGTDVVIDVMAFNTRHAEQLISLGSRVGSAVVISTLSVYSDAEGRSLDGSTDESTFPDWPVPIPEDWVTLAPADSGYSAGKSALELALRERAPFPVTILRPGAIHGRHSAHLREWYFIKRALDRRRYVVLPYEGKSIFQPTATVNLAELVALAAAKPATRILNCGDIDPPNVAEISETVDQLTGWDTERVLVDAGPPSPSVGSHPWAVPRPVVSDMALARDELGYAQVASYAEALAGTVPWAIEAAEGRDWREVFPTLARYPEEQFDYEAEDAFLATGLNGDAKTD